MITQEVLDNLVIKYETPDFIKKDPVQFVHKFSGKENIEIAGFIASLFAYGNRKMFINKLNDLFNRTTEDIIGYVKQGDFLNLMGMEYRFSKDYDIIPIFKILNKLYTESDGLEELFKYGYNKYPRMKIEHPRYDKFLQVITDYFYGNVSKDVGQGFYHMIPNPQKGGAMKRMNMYLRWMIRRSSVDIGLWKFMKPSDLYIPLDVHVARISRSMGLLNRKSNDFQAVLELTNNLKNFSPDDPVKYDFAMFAFGVELNREVLKGVKNVQRF